MADEGQGSLSVNECIEDLELALDGGYTGRDYHDMLDCWRRGNRYFVDDESEDGLPHA